MKEVCLDDLKKEYEPLRKKYKLDDFSKLNENFEIEKIQERETEFLLREIRRAVSEKIAAFLRFFELFVSPQSSPVFVMTHLKNLSAKEKEIIEKMYLELVKIELTAVTLDIVYNEAKEAEFIKETTRKWYVMQPQIKSVANIILKVEPNVVEKKGKSYFG